MRLLLVSVLALGVVTFDVGGKSERAVAARKKKNRNNRGGNQAQRAAAEQARRAIQQRVEQAKRELAASQQRAATAHAAATQAQAKAAAAASARKAAQAEAKAATEYLQQLEHDLASAQGPDTPYGQAQHAAPRSRSAELLFFAAETPTALLAKVERFSRELANAVAAAAPLDLAEVAYSHFLAHSPQGDARAALVVGHLDELTERLQRLERLLREPGEEPQGPEAGVFYQSTPDVEALPVAFLFPGQGSQYPNMLGPLSAAFPELIDVFSRVDERLRTYFDQPFSRYVYPPPAFDNGERAAAEEALKATAVAQPAMGMCSLAMLRLLASFGVQPAWVGGHSYGELVALHAAGCINEETLVDLSWARGEAMQAVVRNRDIDTGTMLAAHAAPEAVEQAIAEVQDVWIANMNSPAQTVISGTEGGIEKAARQLDRRGIATARIPVACAFHTRIMAPAQAAFAEVLAKVELREPLVPVFSNATAHPYPAQSSQVRKGLLKQIVSPVRFSEQVERLYERGARLFVEVGPNQVLSKLVSRILGDRPHVAIPTDTREGEDVRVFLSALARLAVEGVPLELETLYRGRELNEINLRGLAQTHRSQLPPHIWLVNGAYARPAGEPERDPRPKASMMAKQSKVTDGMEPAREAGSQPLAGPEHAVETGMPPAAGDLNDDVFLRFQDTMQQFLETQQKVMQAYLGGTPAAPPSADAASSLPAIEPDAVPSAAPAEPPVAPAPSAPVASPAPAAKPDKPPKEWSSGAEDLESRLLDIVAERTGYPTEMLDLNASMEADLGIDSIKRVEIIAALRREVLPELQEPPSWFMERMTAARTMQDVLDGVRELVGDSTAPSSSEEEERPSSPQDPVDLGNLEECLVELVAERTGYPPEMLEWEANLEADLGIDSIKRVEIIAALRRLVLPELEEPPGWFMEKMTAARSMRAIVEGVRELVEALPASTEPAAEEKDRDTVPDDAGADSPRAPRCVVGVRETPYRSRRPKQVPEGVLLLTDDGRGVAQALQQHWHVAGGRAAILETSALASAETTREAVERVRKERGRIVGVVHLLPMQHATLFPGIDAEQWNRYVENEIRGALFLIQAVVPECNASVDGSFFFSAFSVGGGDFDAGDDSECMFPWRGGLAGLLKCAAKEWEQVRFRAIDLDEIPNGQLEEIILREWAEPAPVEVGYRNARRLALQPVRSEFPEERPGTDCCPIDSGSVVVATGGGRGITAEAVLEVARHTRATFILLARSPKPAGEENPHLRGVEDRQQLRRVLAESLRSGNPSITPGQIEEEVSQVLAARGIRRTLRALEALGSSAEYIQCDVRDSRLFEHALRDIQRRFGKIDAVIHGAGLIEDKYIVDKTADSFDRVVSTKTEPLLTLTKVLDPGCLKVFMLFSSVAGLMGNAGQADYAAANEMLNRLARRIQHFWHVKAVSINWGPWAGTGMVTEEVARQFRARGVGMVSVQAGRRAVWEEILHQSDPHARVIVGEGDWLEEADRAPAATGIDPNRLPLIAAPNISTADDGTLEARVVLEPSRQRFLRDHVIDGSPVLPLAFAVELMAESIVAAAPGWHVIRVTNVRMLSGVVVEGARRELLVQVQPLEQKGGEGAWRSRIVDPGMPFRALYEGVVHMARRPAVSYPTAPAFDAFEESFPLSVADAYREWLFHGPLFQVIEELRGMGADGVEGVVRPADWTEPLGEGALDNGILVPLLLDAGPQLAMLWSRARFDTSPLPHRIAACHRFGPIGKEPLRIVFRTNGQTDRNAYRADVWYIRDGKVLAHVEGLEGAGSAALNRITEKP